MSLAKAIRHHRFSLSYTNTLLIASALVVAYYGLIYIGPLDHAVLRRFSTGHWTMFGLVGLFAAMMAALIYKYWAVTGEQSTTLLTQQTIGDLIAEGTDIPPQRRPKWLQASWLTAPRPIQESWLGNRIGKALAMQTRRSNRSQVDHDLESLARIDAESVRESYVLIKAVLLSLLALGVMGTMLAISEMHGGSIASAWTAARSPVSQTDTAMPLVASPVERTAFDPFMTSLTLAVIGMLVMQSVRSLETRALQDIDLRAQDSLIEYLATDSGQVSENLYEPVKQMADDIITAIQQLVEQQAVIWSRSVTESQRQWSAWTQTATERIEGDLGKTISTALRDHVESMEKLQSDAARQIDSRWQQWQVTLSDQARNLSSQQKELIRLADLMQTLIDSTCKLQNLETVILESVGRLENINRLEQASQCVGEAVAVLATSLERAGVIRGTPVRPRVAARKSDSDIQDEEQLRRAA